MQELVVMGSDKRLSLRGQNVLIKNKNGVIDQVIALDRLESISVFGNSQLSTQLIKAIANRQINLHYFSQSGAYLSSLMSAKHFNYQDQVDQFVSSLDSSFSLELSKRIIQSKVQNQKMLLQAYDEERVILADELAKFDDFIQSIKNAESLDSLRGFEGKAATLYYFYLKWLLPHDIGFQRRTKHPPKDPFSSLLSLGYSMLYSYILGQIYKYGLNPGIAMMHQNKRKHACLASDLMEEWRPIIVDDTAVRLVINQVILPEHFEKDDQGRVRLEKDCRRDYLNQLNNRMFESHDYFRDKHRYSARYAINLQLESLKRAFSSRDVQNYRTLVIGEMDD